MNDTVNGTAFILDPSSAQAPAFPQDIAPLDFGVRRAKAVVIGGGSGAPISIKTLLALGFDTSAVVAMADDGGSTGKLREAVHATAPGDIRKCLAAMASPDNALLAKALQTRLAFAEGHALGNLVLATLEQCSGSFEEALRICERMLGCRGEVIPSALDPVTLRATLRDGRIIDGQKAITHASSRVERIEVVGERIPKANPRALEAIAQADLIVLGPGSLFTSVLSSLGVGDIAQAVRESPGARVCLTSIADTQGEAEGLTAAGYLDAYSRHGLTGAIDYALINDDRTWDNPAIRPVGCDREGLERFAAAGTTLLIADYRDHIASTWHSPAALARALSEVAKQCHLLQR